MGRELTFIQKAEQSLHKKYRKEIWAPFLTAVNTYKLISEGDRIAVCISGGKDSMCMAKLLQMLQRQSDFPFGLEFIVMDPGYNEVNRKKIEENAEKLGIPVHIFETNIFAVADSEARSPCYLCARMRRGHLYNMAKNLRCNKIALGHHLNDIIETALMSMFYSSKLETIIPKAKSENFEGMELIRPMYRVKENDIERWAAYNGLEFIRCACRMTEKNDMENTSKRKEVKELIAQLKKDNPDIEDNIFRAVHAVYLKTFPGVVTASGRYSFLDFYPDGIEPDRKAKEEEVL